MKKRHYIVKLTNGHLGGGIIERVEYFTNKQQCVKCLNALIKGNEQKNVVYWSDWEWITTG